MNVVAGHAVSTTGSDEMNHQLARLLGFGLPSFGDRVELIRKWRP
jgi:hypothetical protein